MFYWECHKVALSILRAMAFGIGLEDTDFFEQFHSGNNCQLRLLHYPPVPAADVENKKVARMPAHTDWSTITMLFQDDCGGLEVEDPHTPGKFVPATPMPGACVMNVGDMLMRWSNGKWIPGVKSALVADGKNRLPQEHASPCWLATTCRSIRR
jgi:isopenicillin N synthase-like dioxygenase